MKLKDAPTQDELQETFDDLAEKFSKDIIDSPPFKLRKSFEFGSPAGSFRGSIYETSKDIVVECCLPPDPSTRITGSFLKREVSKEKASLYDLYLDLQNIGDIIRHLSSEIWQMSSSIALSEPLKEVNYEEDT